MNAVWLRFLPNFMRERLDGRRHVQQAMGNTGWLFADRVLRLAVGMVITIGMARVFGPAEFGQFNFAVAFVALFSQIATLGLDGIVVRNLVHDPAQKNRILGSAFVLKVCGSLVTVALCAAAIALLPAQSAETRTLVTILAFGLLFQSVDVVDYWFQSTVSSKYVVLAKAPAFLSFAMVRLLLLLGPASLAAFAWAQSLELLIAAVGLVVAYQRLGGRLREWRALYDYALVLLRESWPLILAGLSVVLYMKIDIVMLGAMSGDRETGLYSAAARLSEGFYFLPMIIVSSLTPMLLRARASGAEQYRQSLLKLYVLMVRISLAIAVPLLVFSPLLVEVLYGAQYRESAAILQVHVWAAVAVFLGVASSQYLTAEGWQKLSLYRTVSGLIVNVLLNLALIPAYGAMGAAVATLISYFVATFSIIVSRDGATQGQLMLRAMNPFIALGLRAVK